MELSLKEYKFFCDLVDQDIYETIKPETCVNARISFGGPRVDMNRAQCVLGKKLIAKQRAVLRHWQENM